MTLKKHRSQQHRRSPYRRHVLCHCSRARRTQGPSPDYAVETPGSSPIPLRSRRRCPPTASGLASDFHREPGCAELVGFNLLLFVDPNAFDCPLTVEMREWWYASDLAAAGGPGESSLGADLPHTRAGGMARTGCGAGLLRARGGARGRDGRRCADGRRVGEPSFTADRTRDQVSIHPAQLGSAQREPNPASRSHAHRRAWRAAGRTIVSVQPHHAGQRDHVHQD